MSFQLYSLSTCVYRCSGMDTPHTTCILDPAARGLWYPIGISGHWAVCREKTDFQISKIDWVGHLCAWHHVWQELHPEKDERRSPHQVLHGHQWASRIFVSRISRISFHNNYADIVFLFWPQFPLAIKSYSPPKFERYWTMQREAVHHHYFAGKVRRLNLHDGNLVQHVDRGEYRH